MIFCTLITYSQIQYTRTKDLGFNKDNLLVIDINSSGSRKNFQSLKSEFLKNPDVENVTVSTRIPGDWKDLTEVKAHKFGENQQQDRKTFYIGADYDFIKTFGMDLIEGRNFSENYSGDSTNILLNKETEQAFGLDNPIGKRLMISEGKISGTFTVIGVVDNFIFQSLHEKISPMIIGYWNNPFISIDYFTARSWMENSGNN